MTTYTSKRDAQAIQNGVHSNPFSVLGLQEWEDQLVVRVFIPGACEVEVIHHETGALIEELERDDVAPDLFAKPIAGKKEWFAYKIRARVGDHVWIQEDPYRFGPVIGELDEYLLGEGTHQSLWKVLGAHVITHDGVEGTHFAVWAPNARRASVVGNWNNWDGRRHAMRPRGVTGVWEIFIPQVGEGQAYKYELLDRQGQLLPLKADPVGFGSEHAPRTASIVRKLDGHDWRDDEWMQGREQTTKIDKPISIYEVHLGSWRRVKDEGNRPLSYSELAEQLVPYVKDMGFTHVEMMPISEYPFDGSWGYQPVGLFAPTIRHGTLEEFRDMVEAFHAAGIGVLIDWVPGHFPEDPHGLARFDGTALYEHEDRREGFHPDWNTLVYNYGRREVSNFLSANALYWFNEHHIDGLRVDAVASMLYRDYSRKDGEWIPNKDGGRENYEAIDFLRNTNITSYREAPGIMTIAEESTAFPGVSAPTNHGGLGFGYKWNMGWMNDTLRYMSHEAVHRKYHHHDMTFGMHYAFSENYILPLSHDEVVHGKGSLLSRMPGYPADQFANLRAYFGFMWGHPGKKLLFMGGEFAQGEEWNHNESLDWHLLQYDFQRGVQSLVRDLNRVYREVPALHRNDSNPKGFEWIECHSAENSVFAWIRYGDEGDAPVLVVCNMTPVERQSYRLGVPKAGRWVEILNTDSSLYAGGGRGNLGAAETENIGSHERDVSLSLTLPPLSTLYFQLEQA
ncbi:1,4-alpha-glucan branching enzyme [Cohaesibacter marisflavi]|uniref:1,4-alpha-glucan branching enzyme GlgB n=1 Tax=Cohaesibacter marisflavi TaxID=655353 RepID=A0A1I5JS13_9HYPH|nr:1,4-alpha-glucan branching protein GlgB [Cohaesibacter marisflavi]SFO75293.1 1,4-alpha-glucan branching enzyme [Cohaesibacter marisflavi]